MVIAVHVTPRLMPDNNLTSLGNFRAAVQHRHSYTPWAMNFVKENKDRKIDPVRSTFFCRWRRFRASSGQAQILHAGILRVRSPGLQRRLLHTATIGPCAKQSKAPAATTPSTSTIRRATGCSSSATWTRSAGTARAARRSSGAASRSRTDRRIGRGPLLQRLQLDDRGVVVVAHPEG